MNPLVTGWVDGLEERSRALRAYWETRYGPWEAVTTWPPKPPSPCSDCWARCVHDADAAPETVAPATTFFDAYEARYLVCERHWRQRMREAGATDADLLRLLVEQGGFTEAEAAAMVAEDQR